MSLNEIMGKLAVDKNCQIFPPSNSDFKIKRDNVLPNDLIDFYAICDGVKLFSLSGYPFEIVGRAQLIETNVASIKNNMKIYQKIGTPLL